jgi:hypothetical protein
MSQKSSLLQPAQSVS